MKNSYFSATCEDEWKEYDIDGEKYCFLQLDYETKAEDAQAACEDYEGSLPLPTSSAQNEDLWEVINTHYGYSYALIGISDSG